MGEKTFTREELYALVWAEPISTIAQRLGISGRGLGRACERHGIPVPERGYWQKLEAGYSVERVPLPAATYSQVSIQMWPEGKPSNPIADAALSTAALMEAIDREGTPARAINVPAPGQLHKTARLMQQHLARAEPDKFGAINVNGIACPFHVRITPSASSRIVAIADALLKAIDARGWPTVPSTAGSHFVVGQTEVWLWITERIRRVDHVETAEERAQEERRKKSKSWDYSLSFAFPPKWDFLSTGEITIEIYGARSGSVPTKIKDTKDQTVEGRLNELMTLIWQAAAVSDAEHAQERAREQRQREHEAEQARQRVLREAEIARKQMLVKEAEAWRQAEDIRAYVRAVSERPESAGDEFDAWSRWALQTATALDPTSRAPWRVR